MVYQESGNLTRDLEEDAKEEEKSDHLKLGESASEEKHLFPVYHRFLACVDPARDGFEN